MRICLSIECGIVLLAFAAGCGAPRPQAAGSAQVGVTHATSTAKLQVGHLLKPDPASTLSATLEFAPLIVQRIDLTQEVRPGGTSSFIAWETNHRSGTNPVVYAHAGETTLAGQRRRQLMYVWLESAQPAGELRLQGIRIILNRVGNPVLWEVLVPSPIGPRLYVAESLETAAQTRFGRPLPFAGHAVERPTSVATRTEVAGILADGPIPMGPIVITGSTPAQVDAVLCRCMAIPIERIETTAVYEIRPLTDLIGLLPGNTAIGPVIDHLDNSSGLDPIDQLLRLPESF